MAITASGASPRSLYDPTSELLADPYEVYARLRETAPVRRIVGPDGRPAWIVTRYEDVRQSLADPRLSLDKSRALPGGYQGFGLPPALDANLLNMDPPDHTRIRRFVARAFTARRIEELRRPVRRTADELLDALESGGRESGTLESGTLESGGRADLVASYAAPLPIVVICELLGVPPRDRRDFREWTDALIAPDPARPERMKAAIAAMLAFFTELLAHKRAEPGDDLLSALIAARDEGEEAGGEAGGEASHGGGDRLSEDELMSLAFLILFAGYENTVQLIGNSVLALLRHPEQLAALRAEPGRTAAAVGEFVRYEGPALLAIRRFAVEDLTIAGVTVPAGETVMLSLAAANRDPHRFADPDRLDLDRDTAGQVALGHGIHYCLGAPLARLETEIALNALLERFPRLALDVPYEELRWRPSTRARGLIALPVRF
ncbi:cytochrome P450 [Streptomyces scopuliridis]|uniref:Cytochrome P450 n=1 Tax=Streptomyces scopuliridis TaxID=452529 RepID=A0ACD4ZSD2_9ACTN|nr:cytochrome P450 [Streptomyces scopuliridis]WSC00702.1 cytochrome P450 [Streptomyces scopuliridis]WSC05687.1 cytochrome P450 [Streptomyces scopuliridis]